MNPLGMFEYSHMQYEVDRASDTAGEPSITEMTEKAINILKKNPRGYFLMVEGINIPKQVVFCFTSNELLFLYF